MDSVGEFMRIKIETDLTEEHCMKIIEKQKAKDVKEAEILVKVLEGKSDQLGFLRKKIAGKILEKVMKFMGESNKETLLHHFKIVADEGTEAFVSWNDYVLVLYVPDHMIIGAKARKMEGRGLKELKKRFSASKVEYMDEIGDEGK